jgi:Fe-S-cluster-containing hydrogenase component 2
MARTDLVKVPRALVDELLDAPQRSTLATAARAIASQESRAIPGLYDLVARGEREAKPTSDEIEVMVASESVKGGHALVIDLQKCVRCNACVESCASVHGDRVPRLSKTGNRISSQKTLASACYHCEIPSCMLACTFGAIRRDARGSIEFVYDNCVGCTSCVGACPYDVIRMTGFDVLDEAREPSVLARLPLIGSLFRPKVTKQAPATKPSPEPAAAPAGAVRMQANALAGREVKVPGKAIKCDLCAGMPFEACVYNCPCGAILRVEPEALFAKDA